MKIILATLSLLFTIAAGNCVHAQNNAAHTHRLVWLHYLDKLARPILSNLAEDKLKEKLPLILSERIDNKELRMKATYLEAFARVMTGIASWLNLEGGSTEEIKLRNQYRDWALKAIANAVNPAAKDYLTWSGGQPLVDDSFLAQ